MPVWTIAPTCRAQKTAWESLGSHWAFRRNSKCWLGRLVHQNVPPTDCSLCLLQVLSDWTDVPVRGVLENRRHSFLERAFRKLLLWTKQGQSFSLEELCRVCLLAVSSLFQAIEAQCILLPICKPNTQSDVGLRQGREWIGPNKQNCPLYSRTVSDSLWLRKSGPSTWGSGPHALWLSYPVPVAPSSQEAECSPHLLPRVEYL